MSMCYELLALDKAVGAWCHPAGHVAHVPYATFSAETSAKHPAISQRVL